MGLSIKHGKIAVAVIAMLTLSVLLIQCSITPDCSQVRTEVIVVLLAVMASALGIDILGVNTDQGGGR